MKSDIAALREEYTLASLRESDVDSNPIILFQEWFQEGIIAEIQDLNAMTLATADAFGKPHARMVLLKDLEENQFTFFTNYNSHKGQELFANPFASLLFHWKELQRQIRIEGEVSKISEEASTQYFHSRPVESQLGAWASHQSEILHTRDELENRMKKLQEQYQNTIIPKPPHWGGYSLNPNRIEFWQGRANRLHDRLVYIKGNNDTWQLSRLNP